MKKLLLIFPLITFTICDSLAKENEEYPNISGKALFEFRGDKITSAKENDVRSLNGNVNVNANFGFNFNKNWSLLNEWRFEPVNIQSQNNPERYRQILSTKRGFGPSQNGLMIDQLKAQFENKDLRFFIGKFNPAFGTAFSKEKRIGIFTTDFTKDYELRGKIGAGFSVLLEKSELNVESFFNDTTDLSNSAIKKRGAEKRSNGLAGNTSGPSSYNVSMEGQDFFGVENLSYNFGYRNLEVENLPNRSNEIASVGGFEYLIPVGLKTYLIPFVEVVSVNNLSGIDGRNATYSTIALIAKYSSWRAGIANVRRSIKQKNIITAEDLGRFNDSQIEYSVGYKFGNNIGLNVSRANIKEDGRKASLLGVLVSYIYNF